MAQIDLVKKRLGIAESDKDELLNQVLDDARMEILDYCNRDALIPRMEGLQRELVIIYYNRMGSEGESSRSEGGISVTYSVDIPESIKARLNNYRILKAVSVANADKK